LEQVDRLEELIRVVNEAQDRDAGDERRLYDPKVGGRSFSSEGGLNNPLQRIRGEWQRRTLALIATH
jgi:hypothetical protein